MFGGFRASINFFGKKKKRDLHSELTPDMCVSGAYRTSRDDFFGYRNSFEQVKRSTASEQVFQQIRPTKSVSDLTNNKNLLPNLRHSNAEVSRDPRGPEQVVPQNQHIPKNQEREQKKIVKQRLAEQREREKLAAQQRAQQENLRKEREKRDAQQSKAKRDRKPEKKKPAPQPQGANMAHTTSAQYSTNTLESSISRSSGPPPYSDVPIPGPEQSKTVVPSQEDSSGNVAFSKPVDTGSWDMISQHRQQVIRPTANIGGGGKQNKQTVMDLNYNFGAAASQNNNNSDA